MIKVVKHQKPIVNKISCKKCNDIIESQHVYCMVFCGCGSVGIEGGTELQILHGSPESIDDSYLKYKLV